MSSNRAIGGFPSRMAWQMSKGAMSLEQDHVDVTRNGPSREESRQVRPAADQWPAQKLERDNGPLYRQLLTILRDPIARGVAAPGAVLPREADLAKRFGVSLITVRQALRDLEDEGLIRKRAAKPAIVTSPYERVERIVGFRSFAQIAASTKDRRLVIHSYRRERSAIATETFGLEAETRVHCLRATLLLKDKPVGHTTFYFPPEIGARMKRTDFDDVVVFRSVQRHLGIVLSGARITVRAETADSALARELRYDIGGPILVIEMLYSDKDGRPVELTINRNRADLFSLTYDVQNDLI